MHQTVEEGSCSNDGTAAVESGSPYGRYTADIPLCVCQYFCSLVLPDVKVYGVFKRFPPFIDEFHAVALSARAPHGRTLGAVQHAELYGSSIGDAAHVAAQSIDFADNLSFGNASDSRVARHLCNFVHIHRDDDGACAHACRCCSGFTSGMSGTDDHDVIIESSHMSGFENEENVS